MHYSPAPAVCPSPEERAKELFSTHARIRGVAVWLWHIPTNTARFSEEWRHIALCPDDDTLEHDVTRWFPEMVHEDDIVPFLEASRVIAEGESEDYESLFRLRRSDGSWAWLLSRGSVTGKENGKAVYITGVIMDVSSLRMDVKFQHGSALPGAFEGIAMLENSPDLIVRMDRELFPLYVNPNISRYLTRDRDTLDNASNTRELGLDPEYLDFLQKHVNRVFDEGIALREQVTFSTAYGHSVTGEYSFWPEFDAEGKVVAAVTQFRDITDQLIAERSARLNEMRLDALYRLTRMDDAPVEELLNFTLDSLVRLTGSENGFLYFPAEFPKGKGHIIWSDYHKSKFGDTLPTMLTTRELGALLDVEHINLSRRLIRNGNYLQPVCRAFEGRQTIMRYIAAPVIEKERIACVASVANKGTEYKEVDLQQLEAFIAGAWFILRRHEFVRTLQQAKEQAEAATKAMSEFLVNVNHELRTPLTSILGYAETLIQLGPEEETFRNRCLDVIRTQAGEMHRLVLDLLNLSRIEGTLPLQREELLLEELVYDTAESLQKLIKEKQLRVDIAIPQSMVVNADQHFLFQVFRNLIENAAHYATAGTAITISATETEEDILITVQDHGASIDPEELDKIFERFYRGKQAAPPSLTSGTGVGLSICRQVIKRHGGHIWAENTETGAAFHFTLPHAPQEG